jgi:CheY-like chemotaxis protein
LPISLTAYAGDANRRHALEAGYQKHISKPADPEEMISTIARLGFHHKDTENSE